MKKGYRFSIIFSSSAVCLFAGTINYLLFNPNIIFLSKFGVRINPIIISNDLERIFITGYLSDLLWCSSLCLTSYGLYQLKIINRLSKNLLLAIPVIFELLQYPKIVTGIFDWNDIILYFFTITIFSVLFSNFKITFMKKYSQLLLVVIIAGVYFVIALASAPSQKVVADTRYDAGFRVNAQKDEVVKNATKLQFLKTAVNPTIVLRVPNASREILEEDKNMKTAKNNDGTNNLNDINVYNVIEKELLKGGFTVRDRALFEKVLGDKSVSDYSKIKELTETDLIIELSSIQFVKYPVNSFTYSSQSRRKGITENVFTCANSINLYGLKLEFRLIKVKENDFIGSFTYNYMPCDNAGCNYKVNVNAKNSCSVPFIVMGNVYLSDTKIITQQDIESFVKNSAQKLVSELFTINK